MLYLTFELNWGINFKLQMVLVHIMVQPPYRSILSVLCYRAIDVVLLKAGDTTRINSGTCMHVELVCHLKMLNFLKFIHFFSFLYCILCILFKMSYDCIRSRELLFSSKGNCKGNSHLHLKGEASLGHLYRMIRHTKRYNS